MVRLRNILIWLGLVLALGVPIFLAIQSPLLAWRDAIYIAAGFAGIFAFAALLLQPLLAGGLLPGVSVRRGRRVHRYVGAILVALVVAHVAGLWLTSPPDVIDALLFASPTPFSLWGVVAMWAVFAAGLLASVRTRLRPRTWGRWHKTLALVVVVGSIIHALLIEGTMEFWSKLALCLLVAVAALIVVFGKGRLG